MAKAVVDADGGIALNPPSKAGDEAKPVAAPADRTKLESTVAKGLAALRGDEPAETVEDGDESETDDEAGEEVEEETEGEEGGEEQEEEGEEEETETEEVEEAAAPAKSGKDSKAPTLPAAYRRSLKATGWEDSEIDENLKALGPKFIETAAKFHKSRVEETQRFAQLGRQAKEQAKSNTPAAKTTGFETIAPLDAAKLKEHYGEDALIDSIIGPVNAAIQQINAIVPTIQKTQASAQAAEMESLAGQVESFFSGKELATFTDLYGKVGDEGFSEKHVEARNKVLELADALIVGARVQNRKMSLNDALLIAHDSLSGEHKGKAAREGLKKTLKTRERGISLKPGSKVSTPSNDKQAPKTRGDLEKKVGAKLANLFK